MSLNSWFLIEQALRDVILFRPNIFFFEPENWALLWGAKIWKTYHNIFWITLTLTHSHTFYRNAFHASRKAVSLNHAYSALAIFVSSDIKGLKGQVNVPQPQFKQRNVEIYKVFAVTTSIISMNCSRPERYTVLYEWTHAWAPNTHFTWLQSTRGGGGKTSHRFILFVFIPISFYFIYFILLSEMNIAVSHVSICCLLVYKNLCIYSKTQIQFARTQNPKDNRTAYSIKLMFISFRPNENMLCLCVYFVVMQLIWFCVQV